MKHGTERVSRDKILKILTTLLSLYLAAAVGVNASLAFVMTKTPPIVNTFVPEAARVELDINALLLHKFTGEQLPADGFVFILSDKDGNELRRSDATGSDGNAVMYLDYRPADEGSSYEYVLTELNGGRKVGAIEYDDAVYDITVSVFRDTQGDLDASITGAIRTPPPPPDEIPSGQSPDNEQPDDTEQSDDTEQPDDTEQSDEDDQDENEPAAPVSRSYSAQFTNYYDPAVATDTINGKKTLSGRTMSDKEFKFDLYKTDSTYDTAGATPVETAENSGSDGVFSFTPLTFNESGTYYYAVTEDRSSPAQHVTYDTSQYNIEITVDLSGDTPVVNRTIRKDGAAVNGIVFANTYTPPVLSCSVPVSVTKTIKNNETYKQPLSDYEFVLLNTADNTTVTAKTDNTGKAGIELSYGESDVGKTFKYSLTEKAGSKAGVTYSNASYDFEVTVTKNSDGQLAAEIKHGGDTVDKAQAEFENTYAPLSNDSNKPADNSGNNPGSNSTPSSTPGNNQQPSNAGNTVTPQTTVSNNTTTTTTTSNSRTNDSALITLNIVLFVVCLLVMTWLRIYPVIRDKRNAGSGPAETQPQDGAES